MTYEEKLEAKRERYAERAQQKRAEATSAYQSQKQIADMIPMGQPILVGHHSERRHRRDLARIDRGMRQSIDATAAAERLEAKAASYGTHQISSDDPAAVVKLREQLVKLEASRVTSKKVNAVIRKAAKGIVMPDYYTIIETLDVSDDSKASLHSYARAFSRSLPQLDLANLGANIRRIKKRIETLLAESARTEAEPVDGDGWRIEEDKSDNRVRFYFDERPSKDVCRQMRSAGFKWSPRAGAWQRQLNANGIHAARQMARELFGAEL